MAELAFYPKRFVDNNVDELRSIQSMINKRTIAWKSNQSLAINLKLKRDLLF